MGKSPTFPFYASDFLTDTQTWTEVEVAVHVRLLAWSWVNGGVPMQFGPMSRISESAKKVWKTVGAKWVEVEGMYFNEKLEECREKQRIFNEKQREKSLLAVEARKASGLSVEEPTGTSTGHPAKGDPFRKRKRNTLLEEKERAIEWPKWAGPNTLAKWEEFKAYRLSEKKERYASAISEQRAVNLLAKWFTTGQQCVDAIDEAMGRGWLFPVDPAKRNGQVAPSTAPILNANGKPQQLKPWVN